jgi:hypothetical protein
MTKPTKKRSPAKSKSFIAPKKPSRRPVGGAKPDKADPDSKQSRVIAMLRSSAGATVAAMMKVTGWQQHSVRGFLAGVVRKRLKLKLGSKKVDGTRIYRIASGGAGDAVANRQSNNLAA